MTTTKFTISDINNIEIQKLNYQSLLMECNEIIEEYFNTYISLSRNYLYKNTYKEKNIDFCIYINDIFYKPSENILAIRDLNFYNSLFVEDFDLHFNINLEISKSCKSLEDIMNNNKDKIYKIFEGIDIILSNLNITEHVHQETNLDCIYNINSDIVDSWPKWKKDAIRKSLEIPEQPDYK